MYEYLPVSIGLIQIFIVLYVCLTGVFQLHVDCTMLIPSNSGEHLTP